MCKNVHYECIASFEPLQYCFYFYSILLFRSKNLYPMHWSMNREYTITRIWNVVNHSDIICFLENISTVGVSFLGCSHSLQILYVHAFWLKGHPYNCVLKRKSNRVNNIIRTTTTRTRMCLKRGRDDNNNNIIILIKFKKKNCLPDKKTKNYASSMNFK